MTDRTPHDALREAVARGVAEHGAITEVLSYAPEVIADSSGEWTGNSLRFATEEEAETYVNDLRARWILVTDTRVVESGDPVNYKLAHGQLVRLEEAN